jgi:DNA-binding FrmR family transcriptional regulator
MRHATHSDVARRLKRAEGHLRSVIAMIEDAKPCVDIAQQLHAVEAAVSKAKKELIHDHIEHCLDSAGDNDPRSDVAELRQLAKYL